MNKYAKRALIASTLIIGAAVGVVLVGSHHYVNMAIKRNTKKYSNSKRQNKSIKSKNPDMLKHMFIVHKEMVERADEWRKEVPKEEVSILSNDDLKLYGELYSNPDSHKYVIIVHGYNCTLEDMYCYEPVFYEKGYNVLFIDMRAHGKSEGDYIGMGWLERFDLQRWSNFISERDHDSKILLYGQSMGAACVMMTSGEVLPHNVKAIVEDSGYTSVGGMYKTIMKEAFHIPAFPFLNTANAEVKRRAGYSFFDADAGKQIQKSKLPMMFIHAEGDSYVPFENVHTLYDLANGPKEIYTVPEAEHVCAAFYDKDTYFERLFNFADKYVK